MVTGAAYFDERPSERRPIVILGAGGIVGDAHLPAYRNAGYEVVGIANRTVSKAQRLADAFAIPHVWATVEEAVGHAPDDAVYDLALMPEQFEHALSLLPHGAGVLIQKPLGHDLDQAVRLRDLCESRGLRAAVNTQLRFAPFVREARRALAEGEIGELFDLEVRVVVQTPWDLFPHIKNHPRLEITQHSVHYVDLVRSFLGTPESVCAVTSSRPGSGLAGTRSLIVMRYRDDLRVVISTNHDHDYGPEEQESFIKWEGTGGAIKARFGLLMDYPRGTADRYRRVLGRGAESHWEDVDIEGSWFPDAFSGSMGALQRYLSGDDHELVTSVHDVVLTMATVEAAYRSAGSCGVDPTALLAELERQSPQENR